jgi:hypothetical protein
MYYPFNLTSDTVLFNYIFDNSSVFDSLIKRQKLKATEEVMIIEILKSNIQNINLDSISANIMNLLKNNLDTALKILILADEYDDQYFKR